MASNEIENIKGIGPKAAKTLVDCGFNTTEKIAKASADELSQLPGIGKATAEKIILNAKEVLKEAKPPAKKAAVKPKTKDLDKEDIPKPPALKKVAGKEEAARPSVKPAAKAPAKTPAKKPAAKPAPKKPAAKPTTKQVAPVKKEISLAARKAIESAPEMLRIKPKQATKKAKAKKKIKLSKTYGIVHSILHDSTGKSGNKSVILYLHDLEMPIHSYLGRKVTIDKPKTGTQVTGTISRIHGKKSSRNNAVVVRFQKGVSPHIVSAKATLK